MYFVFVWVSYGFENFEEKFKHLMNLKMSCGVTIKKKSNNIFLISWLHVSVHILIIIFHK